MDTNVERRQEFMNDQKTTHIVQINTEAAKLNADFVHRIHDTKNPIFNWNAWNSNVTAARADHNDVRGLRNFIGVCTGAPIILLSNLHTDAGLANGSRATVRDVVFSEDSSKDDVPLFVVCEFPDYTGPVFPAWKDIPEKRKWVPIPAQTYSVRNKKTGSRTQIPIVASKALTTWKPQGMSLDKVYVHAHTKRNKKGVFYTGISRTTCPDGLLITVFEGDYLDRIAKSKHMEKVRAEIARLSELAVTTTQWIQHHGINEMFKYYFDRTIYKNPTTTIKPRRHSKKHKNVVSAAMDIHNYSADLYGAEIADHTYSQTCA